MKVRCINGDFSDADTEVVKAILKVGDDFLLPKEGQEYEVIGHASLNGIEAYELAEIDTLKYGYETKLLFGKRRFIVSDDTFVPNAVLKDSIGSGLCREMKFYIEMEIPLKLKGDYEFKK